MLTTSTGGPSCRLAPDAAAPAVAVVSSSDDPYCAPPRAHTLAAGWGSELLESARGHINGDIGPGRLARKASPCWSAGGALALIADNPPHGHKETKGPRLGLEALLGPKVSVDTPARRRRLALRPKLDALQPGKYQPRTRMDEGSLYELAESIKAQGVMQPVLVRPVAPGPLRDHRRRAPHARREAGRAGRSAGARQNARRSRRRRCR